MNRVLFNLKSYTVLIISLVGLSFSFTSCEKTKSCPQGNICVEGNVLTYQTKPTGAKLIIDVAPGSVYNNTAIVITDMVPEYPANANYGTSERFFAGGMFRIEPEDLNLKKLITISIEYPGDGFTDYLGNNYEDDLTMYFIDDDFNWSIVNASSLDTDADLVSVQVTRLGIYAIAAVKDCIVGDWKYGLGDLTYGSFDKRIVFTNDGKGKREFLDICQFNDTSLAVENFSWKFEDDKLALYNFSARIACDTLGFTTTDRLIEFDCTGPSLIIYDNPIVTYNRFY